MKLICGIQRGILYPATTRFYNDWQVRSSNFWGIKRKSRQMSTYVSMTVASNLEIERTKQVASTDLSGTTHWMDKVGLPEALGSHAEKRADSPSSQHRLTYKQFAKYALMKLGVETDITRFVRKNVPRRVAPREDVLARMEELGLTC